MRSIALTLVAACLLPTVAGPGAIALEKGPRQGVESLIEMLANSKTPAENHAEIKDSIVEYGIHAIPVLIDHLADKRPAGVVASVAGDCYNLPPRQSPPPHCGRQHIVTVNEHCESMLYRILTGGYVSPRAKGKGKAVIEQPFVVRDWRQWWLGQSGRSLAELQGMARRLTDHFWERGWEKGPVEWK